MAIDTARKRRSAVAPGCPWRGILPDPSAQTFEAADRALPVHQYAGAAVRQLRVTPTGIYSLPLVEFGQALAELDAFQTWCGESDAAGARNHIFYVHHADADRADGQSKEAYLAAREAIRPIVVVRFGEDDHARLVYTRAGYVRGGTVRLVLEHLTDPDDAGLDTRDAIVQFVNSIGTIMAALEAADGIPEIRNYRLSRTPGRLSAAEIAAGGLDTVLAAVDLEWGE